MQCCICGKPLKAHGHNPYPMEHSGRCCDECNIAVVLPARALLLKRINDISEERNEQDTNK